VDLGRWARTSVELAWVFRALGGRRREEQVGRYGSNEMAVDIM